MSKRRVKKRKLKKKFRIIVLLFIVVLGVFGFVFFKNSSFFSKKEVKKVKEKVEKVVKKEPKEYKATVFMVGDALIHYGVYHECLNI